MVQIRLNIVCGKVYVKNNEKKYKSNVPTKNSLMCITQLEYIWSVPWKRHILSNAGKCNNLKHLIYCKATCEILFFSHPISRTLTVVPFRKLLFLGGFTVCIRNIWWELPENMFWMFSNIIIWWGGILILNIFVLFPRNEENLLKYFVQRY